MSEQASMLASQAAAPTTDTVPETTVTTEKAPETKVVESSITSKESDWVGSFNKDNQEYINKKGWKDADSILASYTALEKAFHKSPNIVELPNEEDPKSVEAFYNKLGRPENKDKYSFAPETEADKQFIDQYKDIAFNSGLTDKQASNVLKWYNESSGLAQKASEEEYAIKQNAEISEIKKEWGAAFDERLQVAREGVKRFGLDDNQINGMEKSIGSKAFFKMMYAVGQDVTEDTARGLVNGVNKYAMSPKDALDEINKLKSDANFISQYTNTQSPGFKTSKDKMEALIKIAYPD